jgi:hypothetical protein
MVHNDFSIRTEMHIQLNRIHLKRHSLAKRAHGIFSRKACPTSMGHNIHPLF